MERDEIQKLPEQLPVQQRQGDITLADLMKLAEPLLKLWTENDNEKHRRELEYETALLHAMSRQNRMTTLGVFLLSGLLLVICGVLLYVGRDTTAMDLIKLVVGLGGALLGGYGFAMRKRQLEDTEE